MTNIPWWKDTVETTDFKENRRLNSTTWNEWDQFFMTIATQVSKMSKCGSRAIGAVLVKNNRILTFGYNGSPRGVCLCQTGRTESPSCPRKLLGLPSGQGLDLCPAQHAETNSIINAAKEGIITEGATIYMNCGCPCVNCAGAIINAGIKEVICYNEHAYNSSELSFEMFRQAGVAIRSLYDGDEDTCKRKKILPTFSSDDEEIEFWETHTPLDYANDTDHVDVDFSQVHRKRKDRGF